MPDATVPLERILAPIPSGVRRDNEYAADGSGRDYTYEYFDIEEARRAVSVDKPRGDESDEMRLQAQPLARSADWGKVFALGVAALTQESKDLTVAAWVVEALGHLRGFAGLVEGFTLFSRLQSRYRDSSFPRDPDDPRVRRGPYEFLSSEKNLPTLIRALPLAQPERGVGFSFFHRKEADKNEKRLAAQLRAGEDVDEGGQEAFLLKDWEAAVAQTPPEVLEQLADDLAAGLIAFKAWERATDRLWRGLGSVPSLSAIGEALVDCAEEASRLQPNPDHPSAVALASALRRYSDGRPPAPRRPDPVPTLVAEPRPIARVRPAAESESHSGPDPDGRPARPPVPVVAAYTDPPSSSLAARPLDDVESAYRQVAEAAAFLRAANPRDPVPYLLVRSLRLGALFGAEGGDPDDLPHAPPSATRKELRRRVHSGDWDAVVDLTEEVLARPEGQGWLDAHRLAIRALEELGRAEAAEASRVLLLAALRGVPARISGELDDGTAAAGAETRAWLLDLIAAATSPLARPTAESAPDSNPEPEEAVDPVDEAPPTDHAREAEALLRAGRDAEAGVALQAALDGLLSDRARFVATVRFAGVAVEEGADRLASALLEGLFLELDGATLRAWEGRPFFVRAATLLRDALARIDDSAASDRLARAQARVLALAPGAGLKREGS